MKLSEHLERIHSAPDARAVEAAFQDAIAEFRKRPTVWRIRSAVKRRGLELCGEHPRGDLVPQLGHRRRLSLCGETYGVGYGQNGAGERYVWYFAEVWARDRLEAAGVPKRLRETIWDRSFGFPHRAIIAVDTFERWRRRYSG